MPYKENGKWVAQVVIGGRRQKHRCATKKEAIDWEINRHKQKKEIAVTIGELFKAYQAHADKSFVAATCYEKKLAFDRLFRSFNPKTNIDSILPIQVLKHFQHLASERSGNAANKDRKNLAAAWKWGSEYLGMPLDNPFAMAKKQGEIRHDRRIPTLAEFWKAYNTASEPQDKRMLLCYLYSGARRDELFRLTWKDVDFDLGRIRIMWRKNMLGTWQSAWLYLTGEAMEALQGQQAETGGGKWVFVDPQTKGPYSYRIHWMRKLCKRAGVERFGVHGIRHLCASILASKGVPLVDIQHHLRHTNLSTTEKYIHRIKENRSASEALTGLQFGFLSENPQKNPQGFPQ